MITLVATDTDDYDREKLIGGIVSGLTHQTNPVPDPKRLLDEILEMRESCKEFFGPYTFTPSPTILEDVTPEQLQEYFNERSLDYPDQLLPPAEHAPSDPGMEGADGEM